MKQQRSTYDLDEELFHTVKFLCDAALPNAIYLMTFKELYRRDIIDLQRFMGFIKDQTQ